MRSLLLSDCIDRFLAWTAANRRPKTVEHYRYQLGRLAAAFPALQLGELSPALVTTWCQSAHPLQAVQRLCSWCHRFERSIDRNPLAGMPKARMGQRKRVLERGQVVKLLRAADRPFRALLMLLRESMCRPQEARALTWGDRLGASDRGGLGVQLGDGDYFHLLAAKGFEWRRADDVRERIIPISPRLGRLLGRLARAGVTLDAPILTDSRGRPWTANAVRCRFRRLRIKAGLGADRRGERVVAYTLRHTGATNAAAAGVGQYMLAGALGHASPRTTERYVHPRPTDLVSAMSHVWEVKPRKTAVPDRSRGARTGEGE